MKIHGHLLAFVACTLALSSLHAQTLASAIPPAYPLAAKAAGIDGAVVLKGIVSKQGKIEHLVVLSGPPELRQAAMDAVNSWTYKPYHHFGRLVEVETTITVNFDMGAGKKKVAEQLKAQAELAKSNQSTPSQVGEQPPAPKPE